MLKRIVKMSFREEALPTFFAVFEESKAKIRAFEGCHHLEMLRDVAHPNVLFTLSTWEDETALNRYRQSELFKSTWDKTKILFSDKPKAWSVEVISGSEI
jgi:hypothetical protein